MRAGKIELNEVLTEVGLLEQALKDLQTTSPLPSQPATTLVEAWMTNLYLQDWKATE